MSNQKAREDDSDVKRDFVDSKQLETYLTKGFALVSDHETEYQMHPQDVELVREVAGLMLRGGTSMVVVPYLNSLTLAFLVRALAVGSANREQMVVYSPDPDFRRLYRDLSYLGNRTRDSIASVYRLALPGRETNRLTHVRTLKEFAFVTGSRSLLVDARNTRGWRGLPGVPWSAIQGPKVFLFALEDEGVSAVIGNPDVAYCRSVRKVVETWPKPIRTYETRINNYAMAPAFFAEAVPGRSNSLATLEMAVKRLIDSTKGVASVQAQVMMAERYNHFVQDSVLPLSTYETAARGIGQLRVQQMMSIVSSALAWELPHVARIAFRNFNRAAENARTELSLHHPPKVAWMKEHLLQSRESQVAIYCSSRIEESAIENWNASDFSRGCAKLVPICRSELRSDGFTSEILVPGPPMRQDSAYLAGGVSPSIRVLVYPWQARHWNSIARRVASVMAQTKPIPEEPEVETEYDEELSGVDWSANPDRPGSEEYLEKSFGIESGRKLVVSTDSGNLECDEDSAVPTLEIDKFVDRPAKLLQTGDVIILRTGGNVIDARRTVDALAAADPVLSEAALAASVWRLVLTTYLQAKNMSYRAVHETFFPNGEVSYGTVRSWVKNQAKIGPNNKNLELLLRKIGVSTEQAEKLQVDVHVYRSYRMRVYNYLYKLWYEYSGKLYELEEDQSEADERIDSEFGLSLASLESLVTFAKVTDKPHVKSDDHGKPEA